MSADVGPPGNGQGRPGKSGPVTITREHFTANGSQPEARNGFTDHHVAELAKRAIPVEAAIAAGVRSITSADQLPDGCPSYWAEWLPAMLFPWVAEDGRVEWQIRPDIRPIDKDGGEIKYASRSREDGYEPVLWVARRGDPDGVRLLTEGTCQTLAAATWAPEGVWVLGMVGCRGWMSEGAPIVDLSLTQGVDVVTVLDADMTVNPDVWDAGDSLQRALRAECAKSVRFLRVPGSRKTGLDDVLGKRPADGRTGYLGSLIDLAEAEKFPRSRRPKPTSDPDSFFGDSGIKVEKLASVIFERHPSALTEERRVALYRDGAYRIDGSAFTGAVTELLGDDYRPAHEAAAEKFTIGTLYNTGRLLPVHSDVAQLNVRDGMLDLATGVLKPHDPSYLSAVQFPVKWDPEATCPTYEAWLADSIGDQADDLEESVSAMLDPSQTPSKAVFLFGPARSGKSTFLHILEAVAGSENTSGVSLGQLVENRFMAANVFGKALNVSADLSAAHVEDLSIFKMMTGGDKITGDRKYGGQFAFTNRALFAFSANELPTVGESSRAYAERIKPFRFGRSFAGHEDPSIETTMLGELPGILARWVRAWQRREARGSALPTAADVREEFETRSDRVRQWVSERMAITPAEPGEALPADQAATRTSLGNQFREWAKDNGGASMPSRKITDRLLTMPGVVEVRIGSAGQGKRGLNIARRSGGDPWAAGEPPQLSATSAGSAVSTHPLQTRENKKVGQQEILFSESQEGWPETAEPAEPVPASLPCPTQGCKRNAELMGALTASPYYRCAAHGTVDPADAPEPARPCPDCGSALLPPNPSGKGRTWWLCSKRCGYHSHHERLCGKSCKCTEVAA